MTNERFDLKRRKALADAMAGVAGSLVALWTFYPLDVWKTYRQANIKFQTTACTIVKLYRGIAIKTLHCASSSFVYFYLDSWVTTWYTQQQHRRRQQSSLSMSIVDSGKLSTFERMVLSAIAALLNTAITLPLDVISSQHQTTGEFDDDDDSHGDNGNQNHMSTIDESDEEIRPTNQSLESNSESFEEENKVGTNETDSVFPPASPPSPSLSSDNVASLWRGLVPSLLLCSNPSIHYTVFDLLKSNLLERRSNKKLSMPESFAMGLVSKLTATLVTYPLIRIKVLLMLTHRKSLIGTFIKEYQQNGVRGLYKGCNLQLAHTILKSALLMMVREKITASTYAFVMPPLLK